MPYCQIAKEKSIHVNDSLKILAATNAIGAVYNEIGQLPRAVEEYYIAKRLAVKLGHLNSACIITNNLAIIEQKRENFPKAFELYKSSIQLAEQANDPMVMMKQQYPERSAVLLLLGNQVIISSCLRRYHTTERSDSFPVR